MPEKKEKCNHEWRIVENFYKETSHNEKNYPTYYIFYITMTEIVLSINKIKK